MNIGTIRQQGNRRKTRRFTSIRRSQRGSSLAEFGPALCVFFCFVFIPLINLGFIPVRYMVSQCAHSALVSKLAQCEKRSDAYTLMKEDQRWKDLLSKFGVTVSSERLTLSATTGDGAQRISVLQGQELPATWLPGGANAPCIYSLSLTSNCSIAPVFPDKDIDISLFASAQWENLSRDPSSTKLAYFINE